MHEELAALFTGPFAGLILREADLVLGLGHNVQRLGLIPPLPGVEPLTARVEGHRHRRALVGEGAAAQARLGLDDDDALARGEEVIRGLEARRPRAYDDGITGIRRAEAASDLRTAAANTLSAPLVTSLAEHPGMGSQCRDEVKAPPRVAAPRAPRPAEPLAPAPVPSPARARE